MRRFGISGLALALLAPVLLTSAPAAGQLETLETDDLRLVYFSPTLSYLAPHAARCLVNSLDFQRRIYDYEAPSPVTVLLKDFSDRGNAIAGAIPENHMQFDVAPLDVSFETIVAGERMYLMANHELVHVVSQDQAARVDRLFRRLFAGKVTPIAEHPESLLYLYLTAPRVAAPRWYQEGIAVFNETWMAGGIGRAQGAYDEMVFRSMVRDGTEFYDPLGLVSEGTKIDFQVEVNSYLYGSRFISWLAYSFSPDHVVRWIQRQDGSRRYYAGQFEAVFEMPLAEAWSDWIEWEKAFQRTNLEHIREFPVTPYRDISDRALGSISRAHLDAEAGKLYAAFNYPGVVAHLGAVSLADGSVERLVDVKGPGIYNVTSTAWDPVGRQLYYTTDNFAFRDLRVVDPATGRSRMLLEDARIGDLVFDRTDGALWGVRHLNGIATLARIPPPYERWEQVRSWPYGEVLYDLDVSADGTLLSASVGEISGRHKLRVYRVDDFDGDDPAPPTPIAEREFGTSIPMNFVFSDDGRYLYGSSYYTGAGNIFRWEHAVDELEALSNAETGFFRPLPMADGRLLVFRYTGAGFVPATIEATPLEDVNAIVFLGQQTIAEHPVLESWRVGSPAEVDLDERLVHEGPYGSYRSLRLQHVYPIVEGYKSDAAFGLRLDFGDHVGMNHASLEASYTPDDTLPSDERLHAKIEFERHDFWARATLNEADFYDLFGPTKKSRKGYSLGGGWRKALIYDRPRQLDLAVESVYYGDLERLPDFQNVAAPFDELLTAEASLRYEHLRGSLGRVDDEKGLRWELVAAASHVNGDTIPSLRAGFDVGLPLPLEHSSIWLRTDAGGAFGDLGDPFATFFFGGFGNNYVDRGEIKRYREFYALPGLELNEVGGRTFGRGQVEWNLPPWRFQHAGIPSFYVTWARTSLFATGLVTDPDRSARRQEVGNAGIQVDFRITLISNLDLTVSFGWATAFEQGVPDRDEFMASIKVF